MNSSRVKGSSPSGRMGAVAAAAGALDDDGTPRLDMSPSKLN